VNFPAAFDVFMSFADFIHRCIQELQSPSLEIVFTPAWDLWNARNEMFWDGRIITVTDLCQHAAGAAVLYLESGSLEKCDAALNIGVPTIKWRALVGANYKMNVACRLNAAKDRVGVGIVIRDSNGIVCGAFCTSIVHGGDFFQEHARAILVGLRFALDIGIFRVEVEEGCSDLIGMVQKGSPCLAANGVLVDDICGFIPNFQFISFSFVKNICNKAITALATEALSLTSDQVWLEDCPVSIISLVQLDLIHE
jgi:hypothetical protein